VVCFLSYNGRIFLFTGKQPSLESVVLSSDDIILLDIGEELQREQIIDTFIVNIEAKSITLSLSQVYANKTIV